MKKRPELEESSYWPGYVDALTNIVLNLLFMVGIFAIGIFSMSIELALHPKSKNPDPQEQAPPQANVPTTTDATQGSGNAAPMYFVTKTLRIEDPGAVVKVANKKAGVEMTVTKSSSYALVKFIYPEDVFALSEEVLKNLTREVNQRKAEKASSWSIWSSINLSDPMARRGAYVRSMAVRAVLLKTGVDPNAIDIRLFPVEDAQDSKSQTVNLLVKN
jgi:hypothetical protein